MKLLLYAPQPRRLARGRLVALLDGGQGRPELVRGPEVPQRAVGQLPDEPLPVGDGALAVVAVQLADHDAEAADEGGVSDAADALELAHQAHQDLGGVRVLGAPLLEVGGQQGERHLARAVLEGQRIAREDLQLVDHLAGQVRLLEWNSFGQERASYILEQ